MGSRKIRSIDELIADKQGEIDKEKTRHKERMDKLQADLKKLKDRKANPRKKTYSDPDKAAGIKKQIAKLNSSLTVLKDSGADSTTIEGVEKQIASLRGDLEGLEVKPKV